MTSSGGAGKVCMICGEDCSNKPRTKDQRGRYYCKSCHESAMRRKKDGRPMAAAPPPLPVDDGEPLSLLDKLIEDAPPIQPGVAGAASCPSCHSAIDAATVICMKCGFNLQTRQALNVRVEKAKRDWSGAGSQLGAYGPLIAAGAAAAIYAVLGLMAGQFEDPMAAAGTYGIWHLTFSLGVTIFVLVLAFRESVATGFLTMCVPCYVLYFVYGVNDNRWSRLLFTVHLIGTVVWFVVFRSRLEEAIRQA